MNNRLLRRVVDAGSMRRAGSWKLVRGRVPQRLSIATLILCSLLAVCLLTLWVPAVRSFVAVTFWEPVVLSLYETLGLYRVMPLLAATGLFIIVGYYLTRPQRWRYARNLWTIGFIASLQRFDPDGSRYARFRHGYARWWLPLRARLPLRFVRLLPWLPTPDAELSASDDADLQIADCLEINPRYTTALRAQLDDIAQQVQTLLRENVSLKHAATEAEQASALLAELCMAWQQRLRAWQHHWLPAAAHICSSVRVCAVLAALDEIIWTTWYAQRTGLRLPVALDQFVNEAQRLRAALPVGSLADDLALHGVQLTAEASPTLRGQLVALATLRKVMQQADNAPTELQPLLNGRIASQLLLQIERLIAVDGYQEAVGLGTTVVERRFDPWLALSASAPHDQLWLAALIAPNAAYWRNGLLAEAWQHLTIQIDGLGRDARTRMRQPGGRAALPADVLDIYRQFAAGQIQRYAAAGRATPLRPSDDSPPLTSSQHRSLVRLLPLHGGWPANIAARTLLLGRVRNMPGEPQEARRARNAGSGWSLLPVDLWGRAWAGAVAMGVAALFLVGVTAAQILNVLPRPVHWIADLRLSEHYAAASTTSAGLLGNRWLLLGTADRGVQAYRLASGIPGLWHSYTQAETNGALPNDQIRHISADANGAWIVAEGGALTWSDPALEHWEKILGGDGFAAVPQEEITQVVFSPDRRYMAIGTRDDGVGIYDTVQHRWPGQVAAAELSAPVAALAFSETMLWVGTAQGLHAYRWQAANPDAELEAVPAWQDRGIDVTAIVAQPDLVAVQTAQGGIRLLRPQDPAATWAWMVGEKGFDAGGALRPEDISATAISPQALYIAAHGRIGRYDLMTHTWEQLTNGLDGTQVHTLVVAQDALWAGTDTALLRYDGAAQRWQALVQQGVRKLVLTDQRIWAVTTGGALGAVDPGGAWTELIPAAGIDTQGEPFIINDVVVYDGRFWLATTHHGVVSYEWAAHRWHSHRQGLSAQQPILQIVAGPSELFVRTNSDASNSGVYRYRGDAWELIIPEPTTRIAVQGAAVLSLMPNGTLIRWENGTQQTFFEPASLNTAGWRALARHDQEALIASDDGLLSYNLKSHSWRKLLEGRALIDVAWHDRPLAVAGDGALYAGGEGAALLPPAPETILQVPVTAASVGDQVWLSDGPHLAAYRPANHQIETRAEIPNATIRALRLVGSRLWALARTADGTDVFFSYDGAADRWQRVQTSAAVRDWATLQDTVVYVGVDGRVGVLTANGERTFFEGALAGLDQAAAVLATDNGSVIWVATSAGIGRYDTSTGVWRIVSDRVVTRLMIDPRSRDQDIVAAGPGGLLIIPQWATTNQETTLIESNEIADITELDGQLYVLSLQNDGQLRVHRLSRRVLVVEGTYTPPVQARRLWRMAAADGALWVLGPGGLGRMRPEGPGLGWRPLAPDMPAVDTLRVLEVNGALLVGDERNCWMPDGSDNWQRCPNGVSLNSATMIRDPFGRFEWSSSPFGVVLTGVGGDGSFFAADRAEAVRVSAQGGVEIMAGDQLWRGDSINGVWTPNTLDQVTAAERREIQAMRSESLAVSGDSWIWERRYDPAARADTLTVQSSASDGSLRREWHPLGRWADEVAQAVLVYDNAVWLGTAQGLWQIEHNGSSITAHRRVTEVPPLAVRQLLLVNNELFAELAGGEVWRRSNGAWSRVDGLPAAVNAVVDAGTGLTLFEERNGAVQSAIISTAGDRLSVDSVSGMAVVADELWLSTAAGIVTAQPGPALVYSRLTQVGAGDQSAELLVSADLFARRGDDVWRWRAEQWQPTSLAESPFSPTAQLTAALPDVALRWTRSDDKDAPVVPVMQGRRISLQSGRFGLDVVRDIQVVDNTVWLATQDGPVAYRADERLTTLQTILAAEAPALDALRIQIDAEGLLVETADSQIYAAPADPSAPIAPQPVDQGARIRVIRPGVQFQDGHWQPVAAQLDSPLVATAARDVTQVFAADGRFIWDQVWDMAQVDGSADQILLATTGGVIEQRVVSGTPQAEPSYRRWVAPADLPAGQLRRARRVGDDLIVQIDDQVYLRRSGATAWDRQVDDAHFWPVGALLTADGWQAQSYNRDASQAALLVDGLDLLPSLFNERGLFLWDEVQGIAATRGGAWLATPAGLVFVTQPDEKDQGVRHQLFAKTRTDLPSDIHSLRLAQSGQVEGISSEQLGRQTVTAWRISNGEPQLDASRTESSALLHGTDLQVTSSDAGLRIQEQGVARTVTHAEWLWPLRRPINRPVAVLESDDQIWVVLEHGLVRVTRAAQAVAP